MCDNKLVKLIEYQEKFSGKSEAEYLPILKQKLADAEYKCKDVQKGQNNTSYYYKDDKVNAFVSFYSSNYGIRTQMIIPKDYCVDRLDLFTAKPKQILLSPNGANVYKPRATIDGSCIYLHRDVMAYFGELKDSSSEVDHASHHFGVCIPVKELRTCTHEENCRNKPNYRGSIQDEFTYDPLRDYSHSFYIPFLYYVLGEIDEEDMRTLREMELKAELAA